MHAKLTVADDTVFLGSFNLSRSGEQNAENMLEIRDRRAGRPHGRLRGQGPRPLPGRGRAARLARVRGRAAGGDAGTERGHDVLGSLGELGLGQVLGREPSRRQ